MSTAVKTWTWDSSIESFSTANTTGAGNYTAEWDSTVGNPGNGSLHSHANGRSDTVDGYYDLTTTWEGLGVPAGGSVTSVQVTDIRTYYGLTYNNVVDQFGPVSVDILSGGVSATDVTPFSRALATSADGGWQTGSSTAVAVGTAYSASSTSIGVRVRSYADTGNNAAAAAGVHVDNLSLSIVYSFPPVTSDGAVTLPAITAAGTATMNPSGNGAVTLPAITVAGAATFVQTVTEAIAELSPTAHWRLAEAVGATAYADETSNHPGTAVNTPTNGVAGWAADGDGVQFVKADSDGIVVSDHTDLNWGTSDISVMMAVKLPSWYTSDWTAFFSKNNGTDFVLGTQPTVDRLGLYVTDTGFNFDITTDLTDGNWHLLLFTFDRSDLGRVYVDGATTPEATADISSKVSANLTSATDLYIGKAFSAYATDASLQHVAYWKGRLITPTEFANVWTARNNAAVTAPAGDGAVTLPAITVAGTATMNPAGDGAVTLPAITVSAGATHTAPAVTSDGAVTLPAITVAGAATETLSGDGAVTLSAITVAAAATHTAPPVTSDGAVTLPAITVAASATESFSGNGAVTLSAITVAATATETLSGDGAVTLPAITVSGAATETLSGDGAVTLSALTVEATATYTPPPVTSDGAITLPAITVAAAGTHQQSITSDGAVTLSAITVAATGAHQQNITSDGAVTLPALTVEASATETIAGNAAVTLSAITVSGQATESFSGDGAVTLPAITVDAAATHTSPNVNGDGAVTLASLLVAAAATHQQNITGDGAVTLPSIGVNATATAPATVSPGGSPLIFFPPARRPGPQPRPVPIGATGAVTLPSLSVMGRARTTGDDIEALILLGAI